MNSTTYSVRRGAPLTMLALLMLVWIGGRALTWENPFARGLIAIPGADLLFAENGDPVTSATERSIWDIEADPFDVASTVLAKRASRSKQERLASLPARIVTTPGVQYGHHLLWIRALGAKLAPGPEGGAEAYAFEQPRRIAGVTPISPPFGEQVIRDRWSFDVWGFGREGSTSTAVSQGRVPVYGSSQVGAKLQYRIAPASRFDPRLFARAYRAMVANGESEIAIGASARPAGSVPLRVAAEVRVTERRFGTDIRPAAMAVTELLPQDLAAGFRLEAYGGAGYVGGRGATAFVDGQATVTRQVGTFGDATDNTGRLSIGAGAWGGAQQDASRLDVGPTMRLDLTIGDVPARVSVDWRERVAGDASPDSGIAATLSTRF